MRPTRFRSDRPLYATQIINPIHPQYAVANTFLIQGEGDINWGNDGDVPTLFWKCTITNYSKIDLFRVSFSFIVEWKEVIRTDNGTTSGDVIQSTVAQSPTFDLGGAANEEDYFYIYSRSSKYVTVTFPDIVTVFTASSDIPKTVSLVPQSGPVPRVAWLMPFTPPVKEHPVESPPSPRPQDTPTGK
jgi:hypothetical protein